MTPANALITFHDWKTKRRMEKAFQADHPYRDASGPERSKRSALLAILSDRRYRSVLDAGCAEGELTRQIAPNCERVVALDISETAIWRAMVNLADVPNVSFARRNLREYEIGSGWDLILLSDVLPCLDAGRRWSGELQRLCSRVAEALAPGGRLALVSQFSSPASFQATERYAGMFRAEPGLRAVRDIVTGGAPAETRFSVSLFERPSPAQPAVGHSDLAAGPAFSGSAR